MCCRTSIQPLDLQTAIAILKVGLFRPVYWLPTNPDLAVNWQRVIPEEGTTVNASLANGALELNLSPAVSIFAHHHGKRITASVYFEIAAKYAEKVDGEIRQRATVAGCKDGEHAQDLLLGHYPELPLSFERICAGFRAVLLNGDGSPLAGEDAA